MLIWHLPYMSDVKPGIQRPNIPVAFHTVNNKYEVDSETPWAIAYDAKYVTNKTNDNSAKKAPRIT